MTTNLQEMGKQAKQAALVLAQLSQQQKNQALEHIAQQLEAQSDKILAENQKTSHWQNKMDYPMQSLIVFYSRNHD
ncbi:gamma-glutamyl phosphate reductase [Pasteurella multocida subsp. gallicida str. Anand1_poultry]|nr:gamma-glutamyl phosphate reductase [Pasteurella multocida subsp. gallicida str. Anand1_poultry]